MSKLSLQDFEHHISQTTWSGAQDMVASGRVHGLREVERHFWVAITNDEDGSYESEVIITPSKIKAFACECWSEPRKYMCVHIAATLLQVRRFLDQRSAEKMLQAKAKAAAQSEITRLSIRNVLPAVTFADLQLFVTEYARRDPDFAQAFKTRFADVVDDSKKPYHLLLQSVLPKGGKVMREQDFRRFNRTLHDLHSRAQKAEQDGNQAVVVKIAIASLEVTSPLIALVPPSRKEILLDTCSQASQQLANFYDADRTPPELKDTIWDCLFASTTGGLLPVELQRDVIRFMSTVAAADSSRFKAVSDYFFEGKRPLSGMFVHLYLVCLSKRGMENSVVKILKDVVAPTAQDAPDEQSVIAIVRNALLELYYTGCYGAAIQVIDYLKNSFGLSASRKTELERIRFNIAEATNDIPKQLEYLQQTYLNYGLEETIVRMKILSGPQWPDLLHQLIAAADADKNRDKIALLLAKEDDSTVFTAWLDEQNDADLTLRFHESLSDAFLIPHLTRLFSVHLNGHFGRPAAVFVRDRLLLLAQQKRVELARQLIKEVVKEHPGRSGLRDTLEEIWASLRARQGFFI